MQCTLCPRACRAERNESTGNGFCQLPTTMRIDRIAPHLWEEPPISGKNGTGAVFFSGCTLRCAYCQNADISHRNAGRPFTPRELADSLRRLEDMGMHTISFITATPYVPQILETLDIYRPHVPLVWNTSGYETVETLRMLDGVMDVYLPDLKHRSEKMGQLCAKASNYFAATSAAITEMVRQTVGFSGQVRWDATKPDGTLRKLCNVDKLHSLGWRHTVELDEGIRRLYDWYLDSCNARAVSSRSF